MSNVSEFKFILYSNSEYEFEFFWIRILKNESFRIFIKERWKNSKTINHIVKTALFCFEWAFIYFIMVVHLIKQLKTSSLIKEFFITLHLIKLHQVFSSLIKLHVVFEIKRILIGQKLAAIYAKKSAKIGGHKCKENWPDIGWLPYKQNKLDHFVHSQITLKIATACSEAKIHSFFVLVRIFDFRIISNISENFRIRIYWQNSNILEFVFEFE